MPITGALDGTGQQNGLLARVNFLREEPGGGRGRFFINDLNGPLYILNKTSRQLIKYLDFNGREGHTGIFHKLSYETGYGAGFTLSLIPTTGKRRSLSIKEPTTVTRCARQPGAGSKQ